MADVFELLGEIFLFSSLLAIVLFILLLVLGILWILTLVYQARRNQWVWFVLTLLISPLWILYWIIWVFSPKLKRKKR
jgi:TctA family transporter